MSDFDRVMPPLPLGDTLLDRLKHSLTVLYVHGFISKAEQQKIWKRIEKKVNKKEQNDRK